MCKGNKPRVTVFKFNQRREFLFADSTGQVTSIDFKSGNMKGQFRGISGAVSQIYSCVTKPLIVTCGADRILRVFESDGKRRLAKQVYLKQRLTSMIVDEAYNDAHDRSGEDIWKNMDLVDDEEADVGVKRPFELQEK